MFLLLHCATTKQDKSWRWEFSNPMSELGNKCKVLYELPSVMEMDKETAKKGKSLAILINKDRNIHKSIAIDYEPIADDIKTFEQYRAKQVDFLKKHNVEVDVVLLPSPKTFPDCETSYEKWTSPINSKSQVCKKVLRIKKPDGYYSISLNTIKKKDLDDIFFDEFLNTVSIECNDEKL